MAGNKILYRIGTQLVSAQGSHSGDKSIDNHRAAGSGTAQESAAHGGNIKAAYLGQYINHIQFIRLVAVDGVLDHLFLFQKTLIRNSAAPAGNGFHIRIQQYGKHSGRGGGIADAHFTDADDICLGVCSQFNAGKDRLDGLRSGHGGAFDDVSGTVGNFSVQHLPVFDDGVDTHITHGDLTAKVSAKGGSTGFVPGQVDGLHQCNRLGGGRNTFFHHAVVCGEHQKMLLLYRIMHLARDTGQLNGQFLQTTERAGRLGELGLPLPGFCHGGIIQTGYFLNPIVQFHRFPSVSQKVTQEATVSRLLTCRILPGSASVFPAAAFPAGTVPERY